MPISLKLGARNLNRFRQFEFIAHKVVEGMATGQHKSPFKGFALEFAEHRPYVPGDDLKHLDWKLLAKLNRYYVRQYEEDTSLSAYLLLDTSGSMSYRTAKYSKLDFGRFICGVLAYVLNQQQDAVGLSTFDRDIRHRLPPASTRSQLFSILKTLEQLTPGTETALADVLHALAAQIKRRALIVIISDFFDDCDSIINALTHFARRRHEIVVFQVLNPTEVNFNFTEQTRFQSLENKSAMMADPIRIRQAYQAEFLQHQTQLRSACHRLKIDYNCFTTDMTFETRMAQYLHERLKK